MSDGYVIERDIPIPDRGNYRGKYPLAMMVPGDSFALVQNGKTPRQLVHVLKSCVNNYRRRHPEREFTVRQEKHGARCWRTK